MRAGAIPVPKQAFVEAFQELRGRLWMGTVPTIPKAFGLH